MVEYAYEYGMRWKVEVPRSAIKYIVDREHISVTDEYIEREIVRRIEESPARDEYTPAIRRQCIKFAKEHHKRNRKLYNYVVKG